MFCLKQFTLVNFGISFYVLGLTYDKLYIPNFDLRKGNFNFLLQECVDTPLSLIGHKTPLK